MRVISYYTSAEYLELATRMMASASRVGLKSKLYQCPHFPQWWQNTNHKCKVVRQAMEEFPGEALLFLDADTEVERYPKYLETCTADAAAFFLSPDVPGGGCVWFNGRHAMPLVDRWIHNVTMNPEREDDSLNFRDAIRDVEAKGFRMERLPATYNWHEATMRKRFPGAEPVIRHQYKGSHNYPIE